jgi:thymidine kinase
MASGKTSALIRAVDVARLRGDLAVTVVKAGVDTRSVDTLLARTGLSLRADVVTNDLRSVVVRPRTLYALDEAQFQPGLSAFADRVLAAEGTRLVVSGLDLDFKRQPFGGILDLVATYMRDTRCTIAVERLAATCNHLLPAPTGRVAGGSPVALASKAGRGRCGAPALFSQRLQAGGDAQVVIDAGGSLYHPACGAHHTCEPGQEGDWAETDESWKVGDAVPLGRSGKSNAQLR